MKKLVLVFSAFLSTAAFADGFDCFSQAGGIHLVVENFRNASQGTRNVEYMEISNVPANAKNKIRFESAQDTLRNRSTYYIAKVDLRYSQIRTSGLKIFNQSIVDFETLYLDVDFSYSNPIGSGEKVRAQFSAIERESKELKKMSISCSRTITE